MKLAVLGAGAGGASTVVELIGAGHDVVWWNRREETLAPFRAAGLGYFGVLGEGRITVPAMTTDLAEAIDGREALIVVLPTILHERLAAELARTDWPSTKPVILNPGHTGGAFAFHTAWQRAGGHPSPIAELSTLTVVARKPTPDSVNITGRARQVRAAGLPGSQSAVDLATRLLPGVIGERDVLATSLANVNMVLHAPGAVLASAWVEATGGDFTFYVQGMTPGVARTMRRLDDERLAVARAFGITLPDVVGEMRMIGTVESDGGDATPEALALAIAGGQANRRIKAPESLASRYYLEDFGHGLLPFVALARIAEVATPVADALLQLGSTVVGRDFTTDGKTAAAMGIAGMSRAALLAHVGTADPGRS